MGAKIKMYGLVFSVLYVVVLAKTDDKHHIKQRILETNGINGTLDSVPNIPQNASLADIQSILSSSLDPSQKLEQVLDKLGAKPPPTSYKKISTKSKNNKPNEAKVLLHDAVKSNGTNNTDGSNLPPQKQKFNVSSLLRNNETAVEPPNVFPNGTSVNGTINIIEGDPEKLQTMISQTYNTTEKTNIQSEIQNKTTVTNDNHAEINNKNQANTETNNKTDTEVKDLLHNNNIQNSDDSNQVPKKPQGSIQIPDKINDETERIEDNKEETEDVLRRHPENSKKDTKVNADDEENFNQRRYLAAILVSSLVAVSVLCYAVLLIWRRYLENRYGSRTMLVDEEDFDDPNDMRHFSI